MTHNDNFKNESQDARRKDEHNTVHPDEVRKNHKNSSKPSESKNKLGK